MEAIGDQIKELKGRLERLQGRRSWIEQELAKVKKDLVEARRQHNRALQAREIVRQVGLTTQEQLQVHISNTVTLALESVFPRPYKLVVEFVKRRNKTECDLMLEHKGSRVHPMEAVGGGVVDVVSFALRVSSWALLTPRPAPVLILDEPFRHLSTDLLPLAGKMLKEISEKLALQVIMVTHAEELVEEADKVFVVSKDKKGRTQVREGSKK